MKSVLRIATLLIALSTQVQAALIGLYEFNGNLENSFGPLGALVPVIEGGTTGFDNGSWVWDGAEAPGTGLELELPSAMNEFSIGIRFLFSEVGSFQKVIDFDGNSSDRGLYVYNEQFSPWNISSAGGSVHANELVTIIFTQHLDGSMAIYQDGSEIPVSDHPDSGLGAISSLIFFRDNEGGTEYSINGAVYEIRIWDTALSAGDIPTAFAPIPEPAVSTLLIGGSLVACAIYVRRRSRKGA
jgi:hypothetical protein